MQNYWLGVQFSLLRLIVVSFKSRRRNRFGMNTFAPSLSTGDFFVRHSNGFVGYFRSAWILVDMRM